MLPFPKNEKLNTRKIKWENGGFSCRRQNLLGILWKATAENCDKSLTFLNPNLNIYPVQWEHSLSFGKSSL